MPPRNHKKWLANPKVDSISSTVKYTVLKYLNKSKNLFLKRFKNRVSISEMRNKGDFPTTPLQT